MDPAPHEGVIKAQGSKEPLYSIFVDKRLDTHTLLAQYRVHPTKHRGTAERERSTVPELY